MLYVPRHLSNKLEYKVLSCISVYYQNPMMVDFGLYRASIQSTFVPVQTKVHFRFPEFGGIGQPQCHVCRNSEGSYVRYVCVFRLLSTKPQPPAVDRVTTPGVLRSRVGGQSLRPGLAPNHFW